LGRAAAHRSPVFAQVLEYAWKVSLEATDRFGKTGTESLELKKA
jgi:hypothetical protein